MNKKLGLLALAMMFFTWSHAQVDSATFLFKKHTIQSKFHNESRAYWISLKYSPKIGQ